MKLDDMQAIPFCARKSDTPKPRRVGYVPIHKTRQFTYHQLTLTGEFIREWSSLKEIEDAAATHSGIKILVPNVSRVCNGHRHTHAGCKWKKVPIKVKAKK